MSGSFRCGKIEECKKHPRWYRFYQSRRAGHCSSLQFRAFLVAAICA